MNGFDEPEWYERGDKRILAEVKTVGRLLGIKHEITSGSYLIRNKIKEILDHLFEIKTMLKPKAKEIEPTRKKRGRPKKNKIEKEVEEE